MKKFQLVGKITINVDHTFEAVDMEDADEQVDMMTSWNFDSLADHLCIGEHEFEIDDLIELPPKPAQARQE